MQIIRGIESFPEGISSCVTIGTFDGLHIGHKLILQQLISKAAEMGLKSAVITFDPHPRQVLAPGAKVDFVLSQDEKIEAFSRTGIDYLIIHPFSMEFASLSARSFIADVLCKKLGMRHLIKGFNNHFGKDRLSDISIISQYGKEMGFTATEVQRQSLGSISASSTAVRELIRQGEVDRAAQILGYEFMFSGNVVHGRHIGTQLGFPTANIEIPDPNKIVPMPGVYKGITMLGRRPYPVMLNIGSNPTVNPDSSKTLIEAHIIGYSGDLYGKRVTITLNRRIRSEQKFDSLKSLRKQLEKDREECK